MISVNNLSIQFGGNVIFDNVSLMITKADKIGLVGRNGAGKTTLLNILVGKLKPESGGITYPRGTTIGYLPQEIKIDTDKTVFEETRTAFDHVLEIEQRVEEIQEELDRRMDHESQEYLDLIEELNDETHRLQLFGAHNVEESIERILKGLGFEQSDIHRDVVEFSGGWQMRVELAKILLQQPDLIILDEPTNHLDIESITWLEKFLKEYPAAVIMVSHDRAFLDNITNRTVELLFGKMNDYKAAFSKYLELRADRQEQQISAKKNQDKYRQQLQKNVDKFRAKKNKAKFAQTLIRKLDKMEIVEVEDISDTSSIKLRFPEAERSGKVVIKAKNLSKSYGTNHVIKNEDFEIMRGEHVAFVGKNGMGKTTLSRILVGDLDYEGTFDPGHKVEIGYYAQHQAEALKENRTVFEVIDDVATGDMRTKVRSLLGAFLFSGDDVYKKVKVLSGGEKSRLALAKLLLQPYNFLVLDEPTNHLDMVAKDILKKALMAFQGTVVVVSHDRDFLAGLTSKVFEFTKGGIKEHIGDVYEFLQKRSVDDFRGLELSDNGQKKGKKKEKVTAKDSSGDHKEWYAQKKQLEKDVKKLRNKVNNIERNITDLETKIKDAEDQLKDPKLYAELMKNQNFYEEYEKMKKQLDQEMVDWEKYSQQQSEIEIKLNAIIT